MAGRPPKKKTNIENLEQLNVEFMLERIGILEREVERLNDRLAFYSSEGVGIGTLYDFREKVLRLFQEHGWL